MSASESAMQRKHISLVEACINTVVGFGISLCIWTFLIEPLFGLGTSFSTDIRIVLIFTVVSIIRGYVLRRVFNFFTQQGMRAL